MNGAVRNTYFNNVNIYANSSDFILALSSYTMFMHIRTMKDCNDFLKLLIQNWFELMKKKNILKMYTKIIKINVEKFM